MSKTRICKKCKKEFELEKYDYICPYCKTKNFRFTDILNAFFEGYASEKRRSQKESKKYYDPFNIEHPENWE